MRTQIEKQKKHQQMIERKEKEAKDRKKQKQAVQVIEGYYSHRLIRKDLIKNKDYLLSLPFDC